jgi:hypothetical protein
MVPKMRWRQRASADAARRRAWPNRREPSVLYPTSDDRRAALARVLPLWPHELDDETPEGRWKILSKLRRALRTERRRGIAGDWTYDLQRHVELLRLYRLELTACSTRGVGLQPPRPTGETKD